ncbi:MAG TPA: DUF3300 domain-containing protein [Edaphobacter sp.]|nr:DUF3300 domain-containing protein [Edaphobacter sp.]
MFPKVIEQASSILVGIALFTVVATAQQVAPVQDQTADQSTTPTSAPSVAPMTADQLDSLVAPIALYPDALVAQVVGAAASPDQISAAALWLSQNSSLTGNALAQAVDQQTWDPSVKALTQFPSVLDNLAENLSWTSNLGQAFQNQQSDVMAAIQVMRAKAQAAGTLQSTPQIKVVQQSPQTIIIQPANPDVVYVPQYNPTIVYGTPYVVPLYRPQVVIAAPVVSYGPAISIGAVFGGGGFVAGGGGFVGGGFAWGWHSWNCNWGSGGGGGSVIYQHNTYIHNTTYINNHTWNNANNFGYHPGTDTHFGPNGGYHPSGYYGPNGGFHHDVPGTNPANQPNGGNNGNHGLIGGNGGVQHGAADYGDRANEDRGQNNAARGDSRPRSYMSADGNSTRAEANRGRSSMQAQRSRPQRPQRPQRVSQPHPQARGGGGRGRR